MDWFSGTVEIAVKKALDEKKIFIVYVEGENEDSRKMAITWNHEQVAGFVTPDRFVAIRIKAGSLECDQFAQCYPVLCIPSTYLINQSGIPTDIIPGYLNAQEFARRLDETYKNQRIKPEKSDRKGTDHNSTQKVSDEEQIERRQKATSKSKIDEEAARLSIEVKIAQDKAEKRAKYAKEKEDERKEKVLKKRVHKSSEKVAEERRLTRLQFRFANGSSMTKEFPYESKLADIIADIRLTSGFENSNIKLATAYPRHQFEENEMMSTLSELNLIPSAALVVSQHETENTVTSHSRILDFIQFVLAPVISLLLYIKMLLFSPDESYRNKHSNSTDIKSSESQKGNGMKNNVMPFKREGKVHQLKQDDDDDDKEKKTWNGNSTQQM